MNLPIYLQILILLFILLRLLHVYRGYLKYKKHANFKIFRNELIYTALYLCLIYGFIVFAQHKGFVF
ncbi:MAG: hypothetical protein RLZZ500_2197 [Bacteroidota bacterium]|jgi:hypothetical protein